MSAAVNAVVVSAPPTLTPGDKSSLYLNTSGELLTTSTGGGGGGGVVDQGAAGASPWLVSDPALDVNLSTRASEATLATLATEATLSTLATEATLATLATEATLATRASEATLATLATEATLATRASEATLATLATEATLATRASEATLATRASEATLATLATEATLSTRAADSTLTGGTAKTIIRSGTKGVTTPADITSTSQGADRQGLDVQIRTSAGVVVDSFGSSTQYADGDPRGTATGQLMMVDDGVNVQAASGDSAGRVNTNMYLGGSAVSNSNPVFIVPQNKATFAVYSPNTALGNNKSLLSVFLASGGSATKLNLIDVVILNAQQTPVTGVIAEIILARLTTSAPTGGTSLTSSVASYDTNDVLDSAVTVITNASTFTAETKILRKWLLASDEYTVGSMETESFQASLDNIFPNFFYDPRVRPLTARVNQGFHIQCITNTTAGRFEVGFIFTTE